MFEPGAHLLYDKRDSHDLMNGLILMEFEASFIKTGVKWNHIFIAQISTMYRRFLTRLKNKTRLAYNRVLQTYSTVYILPSVDEQNNIYQHTGKIRCLK